VFKGIRVSKNKGRLDLCNTMFKLLSFFYIIFAFFVCLFVLFVKFRILTAAVDHQGNVCHLGRFQRYLSSQTAEEVGLDVGLCCIGPLATVNANVRESRVRVTRIRGAADE